MGGMPTSAWAWAVYMPTQTWAWHPLRSSAKGFASHKTIETYERYEHIWTRTRRGRLAGIPEDRRRRRRGRRRSPACLSRLPAAAANDLGRPAVGEPYHPVARRDLGRQRQRSRDEAAVLAERKPPQ